LFQASPSKSAIFTEKSTQRKKPFDSLEFPEYGLKQAFFNPLSMERTK